MVRIVDGELGEFIFHDRVTRSGGVKGLEGEADADTVVNILGKIDLGGGGRDGDDLFALIVAIIFGKLHHNGGVVGNRCGHISQAAVARAYY